MSRLEIRLNAFRPSTVPQKQFIIIIIIIIIADNQRNEERYLPAVLKIKRKSQKNIAITKK